MAAYDAIEIPQKKIGVGTDVDKTISFFALLVDLIFYFLPSTSDFDCRSVIKFSVRLLSPISADGTDGVGLLHVCALAQFLWRLRRRAPHHLKNMAKAVTITGLLIQLLV